MKKNQKGNIVFWVLFGLIIFGALASALFGDAVEIPKAVEDMKDSKSEIVATAGWVTQGIWLLITLLVIGAAVVFGGLG
jgi:hypothetical protein